MDGLWSLVPGMQCKRRIKKIKQKKKKIRQKEHKSTEKTSKQMNQNTLGFKNEQPQWGSTAI